MIKNYGNKDYDSSNVQTWGCDKMFMVREAPVVIDKLTLDPLQDTHFKKEITACCCVPRGETKMDTKFN